MKTPQPGLPTEVLLKVRLRDEEALAAFFDHYFDRVFAYASRLLRHTEDAEDVTQMTFMKMYRAIHTLDPNRDPSPWVFAVASNAIRDHWRSKAHRQSKQEWSLEESFVADNVAAPSDIHASDTLRVLEKALDAMSETLREVVWLRDYEGLSYSDIASALGINETAARKRHSRALKELREAIEAANAPMEENLG